MPDRPAHFLDPAFLAELDSMEMRARAIMEGFITGLHRSPFHGFSVEFAEHRPYNPGDELRHIDWHVYARTGRHYVKQYEEETNLRSYMVIDTSASMQYRYSAHLTKLEYATYLAAGLQSLMLRQRDATGLIAFDEEIHTFMPPRARSNYLHSLLSALEGLNKRPAAGKQTHAASALHDVARRVSRRSLIVVMTDLFENVEDHETLLKALRHLRHRGHDVIVFHILEADTERQLQFPDRPMMFQDAETGEEIVLHPADVRSQYAEAVSYFTAEFRQTCLNHKIDFAELDTAQPYDKALLTYLNKRQRLM